MTKDVMLKDIQVGDVLEISDDQVLPADCILLQAADPTGLAYVETSALDGESNLKPRFAPKELQEKFYEFSGLIYERKSKLQIKTIEPNKELYCFNGSIEICG